MNTDRTTEAYEALFDKKDMEINYLKRLVDDLRAEIYNAATIVQTHSSDNKELTELKHNLFTIAHTKD